jgi:hypothetical protein
MGGSPFKGGSPSFNTLLFRESPLEKGTFPILSHQRRSAKNAGTIAQAWF